MSAQGEILRHPVNGTTEQTWTDFSWPGLFFGIFWLLIKGLWVHVVISALLAVVSGGFAIPFIWLYYGFAGNEVHKQSLLKKGYLTEAQWQIKEQAAPAVPHFAQPAQRDYLTQLSELAGLKEKGILTEEEFLQEKTKLLQGESKA